MAVLWVAPALAHAAAFRITGTSPSHTLMSIKKGGKRQLAARFLPSGDKVTSWKSSKSSVVSVSKTGKITAKKTGTATITARTRQGHKDSIKVKVVSKTKSITKLSFSGSYTLKRGTVKRPTLTVKPGAQSTTNTLKWTSSNTSVATVNQAGFVTAKSAGKATITARASSGKKATKTITVIGITAQKDLTMTPGKSFTLKSNVYPSTPAPKRTAVSSDTTICTVKMNSNGSVTVMALRRGKATITIKANKGPAAGLSTKVSVVVTRNPVIVDLSKWQGSIDWTKAGPLIDLAILRVQDIGGTASKPNAIDSRYLEYSKACVQYEVPYGVYDFARYETKAEAQAEAKLFYSRATQGGRKPVFFVVDCEVDYITRANTEAFISTLRSLAASDTANPRARVKVGIYVAHHLYSKLNLNLTTDVTNPKTPDFVWIPRYGTNDGSLQGSALPTYPTDLWQYTSEGSLAGIGGRIDLNAIYDKNGNKLSQKSTFDFSWLTTP
ncbi:MAG: Ig-like domain-containing protein [Actinomycetes bacterium]|jgi:uncharacterized protein YjdB|nr:Ig-like domain-containing protein [Actinomycetes bacterium]